MQLHHMHLNMHFHVLYKGPVKNITEIFIIIISRLVVVVVVV